MASEALQGMQVVTDLPAFSHERAVRWCLSYLLMHSAQTPLLSSSYRSGDTDDVR